MTKAELLSGLPDLAIGCTVPVVKAEKSKMVAVSAEHGDKIYMVNIKKVNTEGDTVRYENIQFVVENEGLPAEKAFFLGNKAIAWDNEHENPKEVVKP